MKLYVIEREEKTVTPVEDYYTPKYTFDIDVELEFTKSSVLVNFEDSYNNESFETWWYHIEEQSLTDYKNHHVFYFEPELNNGRVKDYTFNFSRFNNIIGADAYFVDAGWNIEYSDYRVNKGTIKELFISSLTDNKEEQEVLMSLSDDMLRTVAGK